MKILALAVASALAMAFPGPAGAIDVVTNHAAIAAGAMSRHPELAPAPDGLLIPLSQLSELPEPEVFAMMLLGLVLIGYRSTRHSDEKFT